MPQPIGIVGTGRLAQALGCLLLNRGEPIRAVAGRRNDRAIAVARFIGDDVAAVAIEDVPREIGRVLIAVADDAVPDVAQTLAAAGMHSGAVLHTCGAHGPEVLAPLASAGVSCGALHPLQTIASPEQGLADLPGSYFAITAAGTANDWALQIVETLDGVPLKIPSDKRALYHAAASVASNSLVGLIDAAVILMGAAGVPADQARRALSPLVLASAQNALNQGPEQALTGPIRRGDADTVARHLDALGDAPDSVGELYRAAAKHVVELARRSGLDEKAARHIQNLVDQGGQGNE